MPKLKDDKITKPDLEDYLKQKSDFSFEMQILKLIKDEGFECEHGGSYEDPVTNKFREFDIRAKYSPSIPRYRPNRINFHLAIEAKNLQPNFPLLISSVPRPKEESFHQIIISKHKSGPYSENFGSKKYGQVINIDSVFSFYQTGEFVGKSSTQVGRREHDDELTANDSEVYDKWSQAVNSSFDLAQNSFLYSSRNENHITASVILPILVVPNNTLWEVKYNTDGSQKSEPELVDKSSYYLDKKYEIGIRKGITNFSISHLEILTFGGFKKFIQDFVKDEETQVQVFPTIKLDKHLK